jgi:hypothetical protein
MKVKVEVKIEVWVEVKIEVKAKPGAIWKLLMSSSSSFEILFLTMLLYIHVCVT